MTDIKQTAIYNSLSKAVRKEDHAELARMLAMARDSQKSLFVDGCTRLTSAFSWWRTPQGETYWLALWDRLMDAGWEDQA